MVELKNFSYVDFKNCFPSLVSTFDTSFGGKVYYRDIGQFDKSDGLRVGSECHPDFEYIDLLTVMSKCLDKSRVREVIEKLEFEGVQEDDYFMFVNLQKLKEELGLEDV